MQRCALVVLSGCGISQGRAADPVALAESIVGRDCLDPVARALVEPWLRAGGRVIDRTDPAWPTGLQALGDDAPLLLWLRGELPRHPQEAVSVVGSRRCTDYGRATATTLGRCVAEHGGWVVSGGAAGIDGAAHRAALSAGGRTLLCAAGGAGQVYPASHGALFEQVAGCGAVLWEYPPGSPLTRRGFLHRNRLISAISASTVLVEAADRSGALNTGRTAADLGRLVLGVPGPMGSPASAGVHRSIADGWATILLGPDDLLELTGLRVGPV